MDPRKSWLLLAGLWFTALLVPGEGHLPPANEPPRPRAARLLGGAVPSGAVAASVGSVPEDAEQEQGYYLQQLFGLYGENGTLSFEGLTRLLASLGLGKVQVVEIEHDALGHGHVSHLDILEVQHKKHQHSHSALEHTRALAQPENASSRPGSLWRNQPGPDWVDPVPTPRTASKDTFLPVVTDGPSASGAPDNHGSGQDPLQPPSVQPGLTLLKRVLALDHAVLDHLHEDCLNVTQLLVNFGLHSVSKITPEQFTLLCPALLYQIDSRVCIQHHDPGMLEPLGAPLWPALGWGLLAITLVSLPSVLAVLLAPFLSHNLGRLLLAFLVALAVGTLCGDALLHLWPHAQGKHQEPKQQQDSVLKGLAGLVGIYLLFLIESLLGTLKERRSEMTRTVERGPGSPALDVDGSSELALRELAPSQGVAAEAQQLTGPGLTDDWGEQRASMDRRTEQLCHHGHSHSPAAGLSTNVADIAWMVILGDGIHNLTDGLAIGAAFSDGLSSGLSTTVAVFCHELPHELGDFAMLLQAGVPLRGVLLANVMSAFLAYLGMAVGTVMSQHASPITPWIFAITAGIFLYVALVDMLPEMLRQSSHRSRQRPMIYFGLQNLGFLVGGSVMASIALFEGQMSFRMDP